MFNVSFSVGMAETVVDERLTVPLSSTARTSRARINHVGYISDSDDMKGYNSINLSSISRRVFLVCHNIPINSPKNLWSRVVTFPQKAYSASSI